MGSPPDEAGRTPDEARHRVRIPRSFAIATTEVTVAQFQQFLDANPEVKAQHTRLDNPGQIAEALQRLSPDDDGPRTMMTWYEAAMYCNWLSQQAGLPESEWVMSDFLSTHPSHTVDIHVFIGTDDGVAFATDIAVAFHSAGWETGRRSQTTSLAMATSAACRSR